MDIHHLETDKSLFVDRVTRVFYGYSPCGNREIDL